MNKSLPHASVTVWLRLVLLLIILPCLSLNAQAQTIRYVKPSVSGTGDGTSWANASGDLQAMITASTSDNQVWVAAGTYIPTSTTGPDSRTISFSMKSDVAIYGGFAGTETTLNQRNTTANPTILSGEIGAPNSTTDNSYHVISNTAVTGTAILDGFTIRGGNANGSGTNQRIGGGMLNTASSPQISNCFFISNIASDGGAMYSQSNSNPSILNCAFLNNTASSFGGGLYVNSSSPTLTNCSFQGNTGFGGAIYRSSGSVTLMNCVLFGNGSTALFIAGTLSANYCLADPTTAGNFTGTGNLSTIISPFASTSSVALNNCAVAINAGNPAYTTSTVGTTDLAGNPRIFGNVVDMGAVEYQAAGSGFTVTLTASPSTTLTCNQTSLTLTAGGSAGAPFSYTFARSGGGGILSQNASTGVAEVNLAGTYSVTATNSQGCINGQTTTITSATQISVSNPATNTAIVGYNFSQTFNASGTVRPYSFSLASGNLPSGLTLATTGVLSGTPTQNGSFSVTVRANDTNGCTAVAPTYVLTVAPPPPPIRYVKMGGTGDGTSWANASGDLQSQINILGAQQVWVAAGTYKPTSTTARTISFSMKNGVAIYGGFPATGVPAMTDRNPGSFTTLLSGEIGDPTSTTDNSYAVISNSDVNTTAILDGFTITGGRGNSVSFPYYYGGGMYNSRSSPTVYNCLFIDNSATNGGAVYTGGASTPSFINCAFLNNTASSQGGAIYSSSNTLTLTNCSFQSNSAVTGGVIYYIGGNNACLLTNCVVFGNGNNAFSGSTIQARYSLFEATITGYTSLTGNLTTTTNPFVSPSSFALVNCSPAINAGDPATTSATVGITDLVGNPRFYANGRIDMGAVENQIAGNGFSIAITGAPSTTLSCAAPSLTLTAGGSAGAPFSYTFARSGGGGILTQNATAGTAEINLAGVYSVIAVNGLGCTSTQSTTIVDTFPVVSNPSVTTATFGVPFSQTFTVSAGSGVSPFSFSIVGGNVPPGLSLSTAGVLSGTPIQGGSFSIAVQAADANNCQSIVSIYTLRIYTTSQPILFARAGANGAGFSWADASGDLQSLINTPTVQQIWVAAGTYKPTTATGPDSRTVSFSMKNGVTIYGGFAGTETTLSQRNPANNPTILSGEIGDPASTTDNSFHVIFNNNLDRTAVLDGFTITGGYASSGNTIQSAGAGMANVVSSPTISNCWFTGNYAPLGGGGIFSGNNSSPLVTNCAFTSNTALSGGGVRYDSAPSELINCSFQGNVATSSGGAIYSFATSLTLTNCILFNNGGATGLATNGGSVRARYSLFEIGITGYTSLTGNVTASVSPFVSTSSIALNACAPAINAGSPDSQTVSSAPYSSTALPATDVVGNPRIFGNVVDMGAAEFQTTGNGFAVTLSASPSTTLTCKQTSLTLTAVSNDGAPFSYSLTGGNVVSQSQSGGTARAVINTPGTYTVSATNAQGCTNAQTISITSKTLIVVSNPTANTTTIGATFSQTFTASGTVSPYSFSLASGSLPPGLSLSATGILSGTATQSGSYSLAVMAGDTNGCVGMGATYVLTVPAPPPTLRYVRAGATGDGTSWANASGNLQSQIDAAGVQAIWVSAGTYKPTSTTARNISFTLKSGVAVYGGFPATGTPTMNDRKPGSFTTILSGEIGDPTSTTDNSSRVVFGTDLSSSTIFDGFVITGAYGVGLSISASSPQIRNCVFIDNTGNNSIPGSTSRGAGIYSYNTSNVPCSPLIINCAFIRNTGSYTGGAIYTGSSGASNTPVIVNCSFLNNAASYGGAIATESFQEASAPQLTNCVFFGNNASSGYTFYSIASSATPSARYCLFDASTTGYTSVTGNITTTTSPFASTGNVTITNCSLAFNAGDPASQTVASGPYSASALPATDLAGNPRIVGNRVDIGAYEVQAAAGGLGIVSVQNGSWNDPATWSCNQVPGAGSVVTIAHQVTVPASTVVNCQRIGYVAQGRLAIGTGGKLRLGQ
ncbi:fibronectin type III domain-containing protein [Spirosoma flavus]